MDSVMARSGALQEQMDDEDDDDEETLQLKLQEIQARLKLKKLQKARESAAQGRPEGRHSRSNSLASGIPPRRAIRGTTPTSDNTRPSSQSMVQVPASPIRKVQAPSDPKSPSRVLLGIDKGLRAKDISLKRAPSFRKTAGNDAAAQRGYLQRSKAASPSGTRSPEGFRTLSFNERLASARSEEVSRAERQERISKLRSSTFGIGKEEMEEYKKNAIDIPDEPLQTPSFSRDEILGKPKPATVPLQRTRTVSDLRDTIRKDNIAKDNNAPFASSFQARKNSLPTSDISTEEQGSFEPYSSIHLSKRILPNRVVARHISGKKILNVKDLLREVKAPDFALPEVEEDIIVFAIVAKKSEPRAHKPAAGKNGQKEEDRGKYMVLTLVDLEYELDLFLFNSGFTRYWKLTEGTVVAILNPNVMPPPPGRQDTGRFSLVINSDEDTILEIGSARDLGYCQSIKKDGDACKSWVNKKRTQYCEFHSNEAIRKQRGTRMEVNTSGFGTRARFQGKTSAEIFEPVKKKAENYDWETKTHWYVSRGHTASDLIDGKDRDPSDRKDKAEFLRRNMEAKEKEREMMKKLGQLGNSAGREYMQRSGSRGDASLAPGGMSSSQQIFNAADPFTEPGRPDIGLLDKARDIHLSPVKRKRTGSSQTGSLTRSNSSNSNSTTYSKPSGFGWGGALKDKLSSMKEGEKLKPEQPPLRKKTRFVTEKGIREAGRESFGNLAERNLADRQVILPDDDDELVIVR
jgi:minichromosome maintenance protein 10